MENKGNISDGYHTFNELYEHRIGLYIALCRTLWACQDEDIEFKENCVWRSKKHSDKSQWEGWFILGINYKAGEQITYHLPESDWSRTEFAHTLDKAPEWDGHTSADVIARLKAMFG